MQYRGPFQFSQSKISGLGEALHWTVENLVLFRWTYFKNRPRNSFLLVRSFMATGLIFSLYYGLYSNLDFLIFGLEVAPVFIFLSFGILGYWNMYASFQKKCAYASNLYNEVIKEFALGQSNSGKLMAVNFSSQLMTMDLWSHRIYSDVFFTTLQESIDFFFEGDEAKKNAFWQKLEEGKVEVSEMRKIFYHYKGHLYTLCCQSQEKEEGKVRHLRAV